MSNKGKKYKTHRDVLERHYKPKHKGWKQLMGDGKTLRCQAKIKRSNPPRQCNRAAKKGELTCRAHFKNRPGYSKHGYYSIAKRTKLMAQLQKVENIPPEQLEGVDSEIKLLISLIREYLEEKTTEEIVKKPGQLAFLLDKLVMFKKTRHEMLHGIKVSFSIEMMRMVISRLYVATITHIKDNETLESVKKAWETVTKEVTEGK